MNSPNLIETLRANLARIREEIEVAAGRAGRSASEITLVAVTKYVGRPEVEALADLGVTAFGENRVQGSEEKSCRREGVSWHMIGHLQRNKVRKALQIFDWIESIDSLRLARKIEEEAAKIDARIPVLLEVNISEESAKTGLPPEEAIPLSRKLASLSHLDLRGLMGMAPLSDDPEASRPPFQMIRRLREEAREATGLDLPDLSCGMSQDFSVAIEEGATLVRIGRALYAGVI